MKRAENREGKTSKKGVALIKARSSKHIDGRFEASSREIGVKMTKVAKKKHRRLTHKCTIM